MAEDKLRLSVPIDRELNDQFAGIIPDGLKAQVIRCLVELVVETQREMGTDSYLIDHLVRGQVELRVVKPNH